MIYEVRASERTNEWMNERLIISSKNDISIYSAQVEFVHLLEMTI